MINLNTGGALEVILLTITQAGSAVDLSKFNYTPQIDIVLRNLTKGNSILISKTAAIEYAVHQSSLLDAEDKNVMIISNDEGFTASYNLEADEGQEFPSICYNHLFEAICSASLYADKNKLDFIHSKQLIVQTNPALFIVGGSKLAAEIASQVDKIINIEINPSEPVLNIKQTFEEVSFDYHPKAMQLNGICLKLFKKKGT